MTNREDALDELRAEVKALRKDLQMHVQTDARIADALFVAQAQLTKAQERHHAQNTEKLDALTVVNAEQLAALRLVVEARKISIGAYRVLMWLVGTGIAVLSFLGLWNKFRGP